MSIGTIAAGYPQVFSSGAKVGKVISATQNDNGIFSSFYDMAEIYVSESVTMVVQYARDYFEGNEYHRDDSLKVLILSDNNQSVEENYFKNLNEIVRSYTACDW